MRASRYQEAFASEEAFIAAMNAAVATFAYEWRTDANGVEFISAPGHDAKLPWKRRRKRLFQPRRTDAGYEAPVVAVMSALLQTFDLRCFYDVGALRGYFALVAATTQRRMVTAHAFEMQPHYSNALATLAATDSALNGRLVSHLAGLSDHHAGQKEIWFSRTRMFETEPSEDEYREPVWRRVKFLLRGIKNRDRLIKAAVTLSSIDHMAAHTGAPDILKIDVDGYEALILPGAMVTLKAGRPFLLLELHKDELLARHGRRRGDVVAPLFAAGYSACAFSDHNNPVRARLTAVSAGDPLFARQETSMLLFY